MAYQDPTPGEENESYEYSGVLGVPVTFSHDGGNIASSINLEIFGDGSEDMITYTTDFTEPNENSNIYTGPITIDETTIVRVGIFERADTQGGNNGRIRNHFPSSQTIEPSLTA